MRKNPGSNAAGDQIQFFTVKVEIEYVDGAASLQSVLLRLAREKSASIAAKKSGKPWARGVACTLYCRSCRTRWRPGFEKLTFLHPYILFPMNRVVPHKIPRTAYDYVVWCKILLKRVETKHIEKLLTLFVAQEGPQNQMALIIFTGLENTDVHGLSTRDWRLFQVRSNWCVSTAGNSVCMETLQLASANLLLGHTTTLAIAQYR